MCRPEKKPTPCTASVSTPPDSIPTELNSFSPSTKSLVLNVISSTAISALISFGAGGFGTTTT
ncbi:hypothetical protein ACTQ76_004235 [Vibrio alginolyticus]